LKIDQSFIRDITSDKAAASLATSIISMAHSLGVRVIAEGVETEEQLNFLKDYDCDEIQGFYCSKPIPAESFTGLLKKKIL
jgi:EAL domain-containing protein (putative c-di-GMP-specific phosphodiesterase class I)